MNDPRVPRTAERLLEALGADSDFRDSVLGDLAEEFEDRVRRDGPASARRWYRRECVRVAPWLMRDWFDNLGSRDIGYFAAVVLCATFSGLVLDAALRLGVHGVLTVTGNAPLDAFTPTAGFLALMLAWTLIDGMFAGWVAATVGRRAPLPSALLVALAWVALVVRAGWETVPPWFLALNVTMMAAGTVAGAALTISHRLRPA